LLLGQAGADEDSIEADEALAAAAKRVVSEETDVATTPAGGNVMEAAAVAATPRLQRGLEALAAGLAAVGQSALLRRRLALELQLLSRCTQFMSRGDPMQGCSSYAQEVSQPLGGACCRLSCMHPLPVANVSHRVLDNAAKSHVFACHTLP
jgi:hypothetical protein